MGRPPTAGTARLAPLQIRLTERERIDMDARVESLGIESRAEYVRSLIHADIEGGE